MVCKIYVLILYWRTILKQPYNKTIGSYYIIIFALFLPVSVTTVPTPTSIPAVSPAATPAAMPAAIPVAMIAGATVGGVLLLIILSLVGLVIFVYIAKQRLAKKVKKEEVYQLEDKKQ